VISSREIKENHMSQPVIPFNVPPLNGRELEYLKEALQNRHISGDGPFTKRCHKWLEENLKTSKALLTHSCTAALEMAALLFDLGPGDEVIMPSYTFVSTANAVVLRGATPVFVDIRPDTLNIDETKIEAAITPRTKAIFPVHYAGVACEMDTIMAIATRHGLLVAEDAAQCLGASYKGRALGTIGHLGALSFHETKNVVSGEGGALLINDARFQARAEILREKGTNRSQFFRGQVDKYTWVDVGSSYLPSELIAALLLSQLEIAGSINNERHQVWNTYHEGFKTLEARGIVRRPVIPSNCEANAHIYFLITSSLDERTALIKHLKERGISAVFHYVPLHSAPAGIKFGRTHGDLSLTSDLADRAIRLPLWAGFTEWARVIDAVQEFYRRSF
jgi:dTDP-4-amino-4,6-dideoxygalactose transaminase